MLGTSCHVANSVSHGGTNSQEARQHGIHGSAHDAGREGLGAPRRPPRTGRARPALHRPPPRPRGHLAAGVRRPAPRRPPRAPARSHRRDDGPQRARPPTSTSRSRTRSRASRSRCSPRNCAEFGIRLYPMGDAGQGIVHVIGPEQGLHAAGHDDRVRRLATRRPTARSARSRSASAPARSSTCSPPRRCRRARPRTMAVTVDGRPAAGVTAKDIILAIIGRIGTGGGIGSRHRVPRLGHRGALDGRPHDGLQHDHRGRRAGRAGRSRRHDVRLPRGPAPRAEGRGSGSRHSTTGGRLRTDDGATFDHEVVLDAAALRPARHVGHQPGPGRVRSTTIVPDPDSFDDPAAREAAAAGAHLHGPHGRHADPRHRRRHGLHRLVHEPPHRGPARRGRGRRRSPRRGRRPRARRARLARA